MENDFSPKNGEKPGEGKKTNKKLIYIIGAFLVGFLVVGGIYFAPSFGTQGFIYKAKDCTVDLNTVDNKVNQLLTLFSVYTGDFDYSQVDDCETQKKLNAILALYELEKAPEGLECNKDVKYMDWQLSMLLWNFDMDYESFDKQHQLSYCRVDEKLNAVLQLFSVYTAAPSSTFTAPAGQDINPMTAP